MKISTIGLDLAKTWFQVHGVDAEGKIIVRRRLRRGEVLAYQSGTSFEGSCHADQRAFNAGRAAPKPDKQKASRP